MKYILAVSLVIGVLSSSCTKAPPGPEMFKASSTICDINLNEGDKVSIEKASQVVTAIAKVCKDIEVIDRIPSEKDELKQYSVGLMFIRATLGTEEACKKKLEIDKRKYEKDGLGYAKDTCEVFFGKEKKKS